MSKYDIIDLGLYPVIFFGYVVIFFEGLIIGKFVL